MLDPDRVVELLTRIVDAPTRGATRIVALGGRGGSGKTTLATALATLDSSITVIHLDDLCGAGRANQPNGVAWFKVLELIDGLRVGRTVSYRRLDWERNVLVADTTTVESGGTVIFEGVSAIRGVGGALGDPYDLTVWVDCDEFVAMERGIARDGGTPEMRVLWDAWVDGERNYIADQRPDQLAHFTYST